MESAIYNDDCLEKFKDIPDKSVQLVVVDLPYGTTHISWDSVIDLEKMWIELKRILKPNGQAVFFCTTKFGNTIINSNPKWFRYDLIWIKHKSVGYLDCNKKQLRSHEMMYLFHNPTKPKGLNWIYNPQKTDGKAYTTIRKKAEDGGMMWDTKIYGKKNVTNTYNDGTRFPLSYIKVNFDKEHLHPTQKPVELCEWLIKSYSNEGDVVMDFTMGSGSTIIACINTNRKYVGIEKDENIFLTAQKRINERLETI